VYDTQGWFAKTLQQYSRDVSNQFSLPWDVDVVNGKYVSFLPENLRFQLNPYISICVNGVDVVDDTYPVTSTTGMSINCCIIDAERIASHDTNTLALKVNIAVFDAIIKAFASLCAEYCHALQRKHWDRSDDVDMKNGMTEMTSTIAFLSAVANDCHRVIEVHFLELLGCIDVLKVRVGSCVDRVMC